VPDQQQEPLSALFFPAKLAVSSTITSREAVRAVNDEDDSEELSLPRFDNIPEKIQKSMVKKLFRDKKTCLALIVWVYQIRERDGSLSTCHTLIVL
jgi:hypothetical protein